MSVESTAVAASERPVASAPVGESAGFAERWDAWQARGAAHDRAFHRKLIVATPVVILAAVFLYALLGR